MSGPSFEFVAFSVLVALVLAIRRTVPWRRGVMLLATAVFLWTFSQNLQAFLPLFGFVFAGFVSLRLVGRYPERATSIVTAVLLLLFLWIKQYAFIPSATWLQFVYVRVGMSYILFRMLHLVLEARHDPSLGRTPFSAFLTYVISFNTLVAGPIQDYEDYREQELAAPTTRLTILEVGRAAERVIFGLFKTNVLAALFGQMRDDALGRITSGTPPASFIDAVSVFALYPLFLYCNFSGYIDIVIGVSRLFPLRLPENFDRPFSATSFIDFWNRWHITLSQWLRRYVYNPLLLALMRRFPSRRAEPACAVIAFFVTFFLIGVWHGQTVAFIFFGFLQGLGVSGNKLYQIEMTRRLGRKAYAALSSRPVYAMFARGLTFTWFTFTLTWFWGSWSESVQVWGAVSAGRWAVVWLAILLASSVGLALWETVRRRLLAIEWQGTPLAYSPRLRTAWGTALLVIIAVVTLLANQGAPEIVYKNF
jgi:D-alanyl-lipoteichoic acid acyltransferase DltB (MBOAT superfamily)